MEQRGIGRARKGENERGKRGRKGYVKGETGIGKGERNGDGTAGREFAPYSFLKIGAIYMRRPPKAEMPQTAPSLVSSGPKMSLKIYLKLSKRERSKCMIGTGVLGIRS